MAKGSFLNRKEMTKEKIEERKNMVSINTNIVVGFPFHHEFSKFMFEC